MQKDAWDRLYSTHRRVWGGHQDISWITDHLGDGEKILDIGCGDGKTLISLSRKGYKCTGLDFSKAAIKRLRERLDNEGMKAELLNMDIKDIESITERYDALLMIHILNHLDMKEVENLIRMSREILRDNGVIFIELFTKNDFRSKHGKEVGYNARERGGIIYNYHSVEHIGEILKAAGFLARSAKIVTEDKRYGGEKIKREVWRGVWKKV